MKFDNDNTIIGPEDLILVTGAAGFIGSRVVQTLLDFGFRRLRCFVRPSSDLARLEVIRSAAIAEGAYVELLPGNLLSREDCAAAARDAATIIHLAAARGEKSFADAFLNSVVTTRNLLDATLEHSVLRRFVSVSSFAVYSNRLKFGRNLVDESSPVEQHPELRGDAYCFAKFNQDKLVMDYGARHGIPYVICRPGVVYGAGNEAITGRVGIGTFGLFLHLGGGNTIPFTYVDNCAEAIVRAGVIHGVEGEVFNVVDDALPTSRAFLRLYKRNVRRFRSVYVPHAISYLLCYLWESYSAWSAGQLPPVFNRRKWRAFWKRVRYSNYKAKTLLGWEPRVSMSEGLQRYFLACREKSRRE